MAIALAIALTFLAQLFGMLSAIRGSPLDQPIGHIGGDRSQGSLERLRVQCQRVVTNVDDGKANRVAADRASAYLCIEYLLVFLRRTNRTAAKWFRRLKLPRPSILVARGSPEIRDHLFPDGGNAV